MKTVENGEIIYQVYGASGALLYRDNVTTGEKTDYIQMGGTTVARMDGTGSTSADVTWTYGDHLGSPTVGADASGNILWREILTPYGETWQRAAANDNHPAFTGHVRDLNTGLTYMQARYYDPVAGRFLSSDPVEFREGGWQYVNRYWYTAGDPVNALDPDGNEIVILNSRPFAGADNSRWGGMEHQALLLGDDERGWTYVSKDGAVGGGPVGESDYTITEFATFDEAMASPELARYDQALMHLPDTTSLDEVNAMTDAVIDAATQIVKEDYNFLSNNCGDLVQRSLEAAGIDIPDTVNPQASINNMDGFGDGYRNRRSGDLFFEITPED